MSLVQVMRPTILLSVVLMVIVWPATTQHATYHFDTEHSSIDGLVTFLRWTHVEEGGVYLATKFFTGCSTGTLGGQIHVNGDHFLLLSLQDNDGAINSAHGRSPWCGRFAHHSLPPDFLPETSAHCIVPYRFEVGTEYRFELTKEAGMSGALWTLGVSDGASFTPVGSIHVSNGWANKDCSTLEPKAESSMEYYMGGHFHTEAAWRGPFLGDEEGLMPTNVDLDCGPGVGYGDVRASADVSSATPDSALVQPALLFRRGRGVMHACEWRSLRYRGSWPTSSGVPSAGPLAALDLFGPAPISLWVTAGAITLVGAILAAFTAWQRYRMPGALALEDTEENSVRQNFDISLHETEVVKLFGSGDGDGPRTLSRGESWHTNPPGSELC